MTQTPSFITAELQRDFFDPAEKSQLSKSEAGVWEGGETPVALAFTALQHKYIKLYLFFFCHTVFDSYSISASCFGRKKKNTPKHKHTYKNEKRGTHCRTQQVVKEVTV